MMSIKDRPPLVLISPPIVSCCLLMVFSSLSLLLSPSPPPSLPSPPLSLAPAENRRSRDKTRGGSRRGGGDLGLVLVGGGGVLGPSRVDEGGVRGLPCWRGGAGGRGRGRGRGELGHQRVGWFCVKCVLSSLFLFSVSLLVFTIEHVVCTVLPFFFFRCLFSAVLFHMRHKKTFHRSMI